MNELVKGLTYILAATSQAVGLIILGYLAGPWLDEVFPIGMAWRPITLVLALIVSGHFYYVVLKSLMKGNKK